MAEENPFGGFIPAYHPHYSTTAFFFLNAKTNRAELFNLQSQYHNLPLLHHPNLLSTFNPQPFTILSSSYGFILCRNFFDIYHVFDPLSDPLFGHTRLPDPRRPHTHAAPAVIAFVNSADYRVVCAIDEGQSLYTFDTFSSNSRTWTPPQGPINLDGRGHIRMNTGISCNGCAYWLTDGEMPVVVRYDPESQLSTILGGDQALNIIVGPETGRLQLGRVGEELGIVVVDVDSAARLYVLMEDANWVHRASTRVVQGEDDGHVQVEPLRFESYKMEVLFCESHTRRLVMWESDDDFILTRMVTVPGSENIWNDVDLDDAADDDVHIAYGVPNEDEALTASIANGVPYVLPIMPQHEQFLEEH